MNIIEQAAKRLEELQRAGVDVPWVATGFSGNAAPAGAPPPAAVHNIAAGRPTPASGFGNLPPRRSNEIELDLERLTRSGLIVPGSARSQLADQFRVIKRPLLKNAALQGSAAIKRGNLIVVTSAMPGEGKTFTAVNLALSISMEVDHSVLLVDADVVRPSALRLLGVNAEHGLMDVLRDRRRDLSEVLLRPTNVPKLTLLPAGSGMLNSTELLASASMESLLDELATTYADRIVIFDAPPLMVTTESRVLAARAGQVVMVVESMHTPRNTISEAYATLSACPVVLSVLNKYTGPTKVGSYGYGY
jgi:protein-tyrosine kinase